MTGRATYLSVCQKFGLIPVSYFLRHMTDQHLSLAHHGLGAKGMKALAYPLIVRVNFQIIQAISTSRKFVTPYLIESLQIASLILMFIVLL